MTMPLERKTLLAAAVAVAVGAAAAGTAVYVTRTPGVSTPADTRRVEAAGWAHIAALGGIADAAWVRKGDVYPRHAQLAGPKEREALGTVVSWVLVSGGRAVDFVNHGVSGGDFGDPGTLYARIAGESAKRSWPVASLPAAVRAAVEVLDGATERVAQGENP